jgi:hypothetical protein
MILVAQKVTDCSVVINHQNNCKRESSMDVTVSGHNLLKVLYPSVYLWWDTTEVAAHLRPKFKTSDLNAECADIRL